jgi:hypothetical protein
MPGNTHKALSGVYSDFQNKNGNPTDCHFSIIALQQVF